MRRSWLGSGLCSLALVACSGDSGDQATTSDGAAGEEASSASTDASGSDTTTDTGGAESGETGEPMNPPRPSYDQWEKVEVPGTKCGDGSQYKFFVKYSETSDNVVFAYEPGGACWDFESCSGQAGIMGAANPNGISDTHYQMLGELMVPTRRDDDSNAMKDWNFVLFPYCTGDIHMGNKTIVYQDPTGQEPDLEWHHVAYQNLQLILPWLQENFQVVPKIMVTGCSAGGTGALTNYYFLRENLPVERGYLVSDSGPIFVNSTWSAPLHNHIRDVWNLDDIIDGTPPEIAAAINEDLGNVSSELAKRYPDDRLAQAYFRRDFNYSRYSYERWYDPQPDKNTIHEYWWDDTQKLMEQYDQYPNLSYYIPYWRQFNSSHCTTLLTYYSTDIEEADMDMGKYFEHILDDDAPLQSWLESVQPDEDP